MPASSTAVQKQDFPHNRMSLPGPPQFLFLFELECPAVFIGDAEHLMGRPVSTSTNPQQPYVPIRIRTHILNGTARIFWSGVNIHPNDDVVVSVFILQSPGHCCTVFCRSTFRTRGKRFRTAALSL